MRKTDKTVYTRKEIAQARRAEEEKKRKGKKKWLLLLLLLLLLLAGVLLWIFKPWQKPLDTVLAGNYETGALDLGDQTLAERLAQLAEEDRVTIQINTRPIFEDGLGDLLIQNTEHNPYDMQVVIYLGADDTGQKVYDTGQMPPGSYIQKDSLDMALNQGDHEATAYVSFWDGESLVTTSSVDLTLTIRS